MDEELPKPRRRWWRVVLCAIILLLCGGEWLASHLIAAKLRGLVDRKLDARLELGPVIYVPPYGAIAWGAKLVRNNGELVAVSKLSIKLARLPLSGAPVVVSSVSITEPVLNLSPGAFKGIAKQSAKDLAPRKLSEILLLRSARINSGRVTYRDPKSADPAMVWDNLGLDADLLQRSPSQYSFHAMSKAAPLADASVAGTIDVDSLVLEVQNLSLKARAEPEPLRTPLPASVQKFLKQYRVTGSTVVTGEGTIPLRDPRQAVCTLAIALQDATALIPPQQSMLEHAQASIVCRKQAGGPLQISLDQVDIAGEGKQVVFDTGNLTIDAAAGVWNLSDVQGHVLAMGGAATTPAVSTPLSATMPSAPMATSAPATNPVDKLRPAGRIDFTVAASGPLNLRGQNPWTAIKHEVIAYPRGLSFQPKGFARRIEDINGGEARLVNGIIIFQELRGRYGGDELRLRGARLPIAGLPKVARWQEISGVIRFNPPVQQYTPGIDKVLTALDPTGQYLIAGSYTYDRSGPTAQKTYDLIVSSDTGAMTLTEKKIEFTKIRGDATVTPLGVEIHALQAQALGGTVQVSGRWDHGPTAANYQWDISAQDLDLSKIEEVTRETPRDKPLKGRVHGEIALEGVAERGASRADNLKLVKGAGQFEIVNGDLFQLPVLSSIGEGIKGLKDAGTVGDAAAVFDIGDNAVRIRDLAVNSPMLGLQGSGTIWLDGKVNLDVVAAPLADWRDKFRESRFSLFGKVAGEVAGAIQKVLNTATSSLLYAFRIEGTVRDVKVTTVPAPMLTDAAAMMFGKMLAPQKNQKPIDLLEHEQKPQTRPSPQAATR